MSNKSELVVIVKFTLLKMLKHYRESNMTRAMSDVLDFGWLHQEVEWKRHHAC